jgi:hypothetical protein
LIFNPSPNPLDIIAVIAFINLTGSEKASNGRKQWKKWKKMLLVIK